MEAKKLILYVSQEGFHRLNYTNELEEVGYAVLAASNGNVAATALSRIGPRAIDLIIAGSRNLAGIGALETVVDSMGDKAPPVIINTSYSDPRLMYHGTILEKYIREYVTKSSDPTELIQAVKRVIDPAQE